ncbi:MAG: hypothetical protein QW760_07585, partial [Thermofilaceae archaeon]
MKSKVVLLTLSSFFIYLLSFFQSAFTGLSTQPEYLIPVIVASLIIGWVAENLTKSFAIYFVTQVLSIIVALMLAKLPIDILLGSVSGDLATLVIT